MQCLSLTTYFLAILLLNPVGTWVVYSVHTLIPLSSWVLKHLPNCRVLDRCELMASSEQWACEGMVGGSQVLDVSGSLIGAAQGPAARFAHLQLGVIVSTVTCKMQTQNSPSSCLCCSIKDPMASRHQGDLRLLLLFQPLIIFLLP